MLPVFVTLVRYADLPATIDPTDGPGDLIYRAPDFWPALRSAGLIYLRDLDQLRVVSPPFQNWGRFTARVQIASITAFLKREQLTYTKDRLAAYITPGRYTTKAVQEFVLLQRLRLHGVCCPRPLALWLRRCGRRVESALLLEALEDYVPLDEYLLTRLAPGTSDRQDLLPFLEQLARFIVRIHNARVHNPDLFSWHILVRESGPAGPEDFAVIDLQRAVPLAWRPCCVRRARDLGALLATISDNLLDPGARRFFLECYMRTARPRDPWKPVFPKVLKRRMTLLRRRSKVRAALHHQDQGLRGPQPTSEGGPTVHEATAKQPVGSDR